MQPAARRLSGVVHLDDCRRAGLRSRHLEWLLASGRWQSPLPRVYVTYSGPLPPAAVREAVLAYAGADAVLSHQSAGHLLGLCHEPEQVHVTVPYRREVVDQAGLVVHRSRTIGPADVHPLLRRTTAERTVLDLMRSRATVDAALGLAADAGPPAPDDHPTAASSTRGAPPDTVAARAADRAPDVAAGAHSVLELHDARLRRRHGLPPGRRQVRRLRGGVEHLDVVIDEYLVHVELDGRLGHDRATDRWRDMRRDNASTVSRMRALRYGWADVLGRPCEVAAQQAVVLRQQGWTGRFRRCPDCPLHLPPAL